MRISYWSSDVCSSDLNGISIDGHVENWFADNTPERFAAYGWNVIPGVDGHDTAAIDAAIVKAKQFAADGGGPTLICCRTIIGKGAPNAAGSETVHGAPLGEDEIAAARKALDWPYEPFDITLDIHQSWDARPRSARLKAQWQSDGKRTRLNS